MSVNDSDLTRKLAVKLFSEMQLAQDTCIYKVKLDDDFRNAIIETNCQEDNLKDSCDDDLNLFLHILAWTMFEHGVFITDLTYRYEKLFIDIPRNEINEQLSDYYERPYMQRTIDLLNSSTGKVEERHMLYLIKEYIERFEEIGRADFGHLKDLELFASTAYYMGESLYMQLREHNDKFQNSLNWISRIGISEEKKEEAKESIRIISIYSNPETVRAIYKRVISYPSSLNIQPLEIDDYEIEYAENMCHSLLGFMLEMGLRTGHKTDTVGNTVGLTYCTYLGMVAKKQHSYENEEPQEDLFNAVCEGGFYSMYDNISSLLEIPKETFHMLNDEIDSISEKEAKKLPKQIDTPEKEIKCVEASLAMYFYGKSILLKSL